MIYASKESIKRRQSRQRFLLRWEVLAIGMIFAMEFRKNSSFLRRNFARRVCDEKLVEPRLQRGLSVKFLLSELGAQLRILASRKRCDLKTRKRCDFFSAAQKIASDFSAISSAIFRRFFCDFCGKTCDLVLCDLKTQRFFCDCDFLGR